MNSKTVVLIHGMYMNALCWEEWMTHFQTNGYTCHAPSWPGKDKPVEQLRQNHPDSQLAQLTLSQVLEHYANFVNQLAEKPILIGHSMGGLIVQLLVQKGLAAAGIAINSAPPMGVFTTKWSFVKSNWPHINPFASLNSPISMTFEHFQYAFANTLPLAEQQAAYERYVTPESRRVPRESLTAKIDFKKSHAPLLFMAGAADNIIPSSLNQANYAKYKKASASITDFKEFAGRTHFILGQTGWEEVGNYAIAWLAEKGV